jgi:hypothetical protein
MADSAFVRWCPSGYRGRGLLALRHCYGDRIGDLGHRHSDVAELVMKLIESCGTGRVTTLFAHDSTPTC